MNIYISRRGLVRIITFGIAIVLCIIALLFSNCCKTKSSRRELEHIYEKSIQELAASVDSINNTITKTMYCGTSEKLALLSSDLWRESAMAKQALCTLPIEDAQLDHIYRFLSQIGNYAVSVSNKSSQGQALTLEEYNTLSELQKYSQQLTDAVWSLDGKVNQGVMSFVKSKENMQLYDRSQTPTLSAGFEQFETTTQNYPKLIYDGPFSDHILEKTPEMTKNKKVISDTEAENKAAAFLNVSPDEIRHINDEDGKMPSYRFEARNSMISVTKAGGFVSYMFSPRSVYTEKLSINDALASATAFMLKNGYTDTVTTYYETLNNICTINFATINGDVTMYTDLIKVSVALDTGEILAFDSRGYLVNHRDRQFERVKVSTDEAEKHVSPLLKIKKSKLALVPTESAGEALTYEFTCVNEAQQTVLVYINVMNGKEEQILIVYNEGDSILTM